MKPARLLTSCFVAGFAFMCNFCSPYREPACVQMSQSERELEATVVLLNADTGKPNCSAVSVRDQYGIVILVTAAHCVQRKVNVFDTADNAARWANIGDSIFYLNKERWQVPHASTIQALDYPRDRAVLSVIQGEAPLPVASLPQCDRCTFENKSVHAVSSVYGWKRHDGIVSGKTYSGTGSNFFESSISVDLGWSGSPVLNDSGEVMGIIIECNTYTIKIDDIREYKKCKRNWSLFTSLP